MFAIAWCTISLGQHIHSRNQRTLQRNATFRMVSAYIIISLFTHCNKTMVQLNGKSLCVTETIIYGETLCVTETIMSSNPILCLFIVFMSTPRKLKWIAACIQVIMLVGGVTVGIFFS